MALFDLCAGFVYSQILLACLRLRLLERLAQGPHSMDALTRQLPLPDEAAERLVLAAVAVRLAERRGGRRIGLGPLGAALLGNPAISEMVEHHGLLYADLADPIALLTGQHETTRLAQFWAYGDARAEATRAYSTLMSASQSFIAEDVLDAYMMETHRCLMDVGGGEGAFLGAVARRVPELRLMLFDLPAVAELAERRLDAHGLAGRAAVAAGDFLTDPLPAGADVISFVRVLHDHDDDAVALLLQKARRALPEDGALLIAEPMSETPGAERVGDAYFGFYLLAMGSGRPRTPATYRDMLSGAGFSQSRVLSTRRPFLCRLIVAKP